MGGAVMDDDLRRSLDGLQEAMRDVARAQADFQGAVYHEISGVRESVARIEERTRELVEHREDDQEMLARPRHEDRERREKLGATVLVLKGREMRREERARIAKFTAKVVSGVIALAATVIGIASAVAQWGGK